MDLDNRRLPVLGGKRHGSHGEAGFGAKNNCHRATGGSHIDGCEDSVDGERGIGRERDSAACDISVECSIPVDVDLVP